MSSLPKSGTVLGRLEDLPDPGARASSWNDGAVILVRRGQTITAFLNTCPHAQRPLNLPGGKVMLHEGAFIVCPVHGASFAATDGMCVGGPAAGYGLTGVEVEVVGPEIRVV
ncbi:Rieske (2Fe-2S) protein [Maricaulis sp.]|uniref:Rieske (2Fe-2S) protein n=1 Tax=Maricaulis sp. TaxID=1486257 RepID=UPI003A8F7252